MRPALSSPVRTALAIGSLFLAILLPVRGQESLVALGKVTSGGFLESSASPIGAMVSSTRSGTGVYVLSFAATGAFTGTTETDFIVEASISSLTTGHTACATSVGPITPDLLTVRVRVADVEDMSFPDIGVADDDNFVFVVRRAGALANGSPMSSRHLVAAGQVLGTGALASGFGVGGISVTSGGGDGNYFVRLSKLGAFPGGAGAHWVILVSPRHLGFPDGAVRGGVANVSSPDFVDFTIRTDDVQLNNSPPQDMTFSFAIYSLVAGDATGPPDSNLLAAVASVNGANGALMAGRAAYAGTVMSSQRNSTGRYDIFVDAPGAFAGKTDTSFAAIVNIHANAVFDDIARARVIVVNSSRIRIDVNVDDVQHPGDDDGIPADSSFSVTVYDGAPALRHDLRVGKKASLSGARGKGVFNATGAGQTLTLRLAERSRQSAYFRSDYTGRSLDSLRIKSSKLPSLVVSQLFVTSAPRRNITASARTGLTVSQEMRIGQSVSLQAKFRYRNPEKRPKKSFLLQAISGYQPSRADGNRVKLKPS